MLTYILQHGDVANLPFYKQVPIRRMDAPRPAPANAEAGRKVSQQRAAPKKRRQAVAGGSTVLAALFCLFIYCGIGIPNVGVPTRELKHPIFAQPKALQFETGQGLEEMNFGGRALQAAESQGELLVSLTAEMLLCDASMHLSVTIFNYSAGIVRH